MNRVNPNNLATETQRHKGNTPLNFVHRYQLLRIDNAWFCRFSLCLCVSVAQGFLCER